MFKTRKRLKELENKCESLEYNVKSLKDALYYYENKKMLDNLLKDANQWLGPEWYYSRSDRGFYKTNTSNTYYSIFNTYPIEKMLCMINNAKVKAYEAKK